jgi:transcriptional regulator with XRE-family HTH domain
MERILQTLVVIMQLYFPAPLSSDPPDPYTGSMLKVGRPPKGDRPEFGQRMSEARERAGLTQSELAKKLGVTQQVVAAWERRIIALRPEQIKAIAQAINTTADYLIGITESWKGSKGPSGKVRQVFEQVSKLPRRQQDKVVEFVEAFVQHKAAAG